MKSSIKILLRVSMAAAILVAAWYFNHTGLLERILDWIRSYGVWGPAVFFLVQILACLFFVPSVLFTFSGGVLFGIYLGFALSLWGVALGSLGALLIGRYLARGLVEKAFGHNPEFQKLAQAMQKKGWKMVCFARLSPVFPFTVGNYAFGLTSIPARHYFGASLLGTIPSTAVYSYLGAITGSLAILGDAHRAKTPLEWILMAVGLAATLFLAYYFRRFTRKALMETADPVKETAEPVLEPVPVGETEG